MRGTVKWFDDKKGYGFITAETDDGPTDFFVHFSAIRTKVHGRRTLAQAEVVEFEPARNERGRTATDVVRMGAPS